MLEPENEVEILDETLDIQETADEMPESTIEAVHIGTMFSGPIPPPETLSGYEEIVPGSAERIISNMMDESLHRRTLEKKSIEDAAKLTKSGQDKAFIISLVGLILGFTIIFTALFSKNNLATIGGLISGSVLGGLPLVRLVRSFLRNGKNGKD